MSWKRTNILYSIHEFAGRKCLLQLLEYAKECKQYYFVGEK